MSITKLRSMRKRAITVLAAASCVALIAAQPANASATGAQAFGGWNVPSIGWVPKGVMTHWVKGSGLHIDQDYARFDAAANICNWRIDFLYYDMAGRRYATAYGSTHYSCNVWALSETVVNFNAREGKACVKLLSNGVPIEDSKQCHNIHR